MRSLQLFEDYTRRDVHDIFDLHAPFTPQAGTWGLQGIIELPNRPGHFVLFVTFGKAEGVHQFDEGISREGLLRWQSQPKQSLADAQISQFIHHQPERASIYLFLRATKRRNGEPTPYTYLGRLAYASHDREREHPVNFLWQLLDWPIPPATLSRMGLTLEDELGRREPEPQETPRQDFLVPSGSLIEESPPATITDGQPGEPSRQFRAAKRRRAPEHVTRALGQAGELLVLQYERDALSAVGRPDLAERVVHTAEVEGDGAGFDISSFYPDGRPKFIEVKTTQGPKTAEFFISANEVAFSAAHEESFVLCRVYDYDPTRNAGRFYVRCGSVAKLFTLTPTEFRAK